MTRSRVRMVLADGGGSRATQALPELVPEIIGDPRLDVDVLVWHSNRGECGRAGLGPVTDAGAIDRWLPARALQLTRLSRLAQALKTPRLKRLLASLPIPDATWLVGLGAAPYRSWVPTGDRPLIVQLDVDDPTGAMRDDPRAEAALDAADLVIVSDRAGAAWVAQRIAQPELVRRHALLPSDEVPTGGRPGPPALRMVGIFGTPAADIAAVTGRIGRGTPTMRLGFRWYGRGEVDWSLWQGRGGPPLHHLDTADPEQLGADLEHLDLIVHPVDAPPGEDVRTLAELRGVTLVAMGAATSDIEALVVSSLTACEHDAGDNWTLTTTQAAPHLVADVHRVLAEAGPIG